MTAISITARAAGTAEVLSRDEARTPNRCLYCGAPLPLRRRLGSSRFCEEEHRKRWHFERLERVLGES